MHELFALLVVEHTKKTKINKFVVVSDYISGWSKEPQLISVAVLFGIVF